MVRFIFVCMTIVALSVLTMASQYMMDGISEAQQYVELRNLQPAIQPQQNIAAVETPAPADFSAEALNNIDTAAGDTDAPRGSGFGAGFTNVAPKGLEDTPAIAPADVAEPAAPEAN